MFTAESWKKSERGGEVEWGWGFVCFFVYPQSVKGLCGYLALCGQQFTHSYLTFSDFYGGESVIKIRTTILLNKPKYSLI